MKKIVMILLIASMVIGLTLTGCSSLKDEVKKTLNEEGLDADEIVKNVVEINKDTEEPKDKTEDTDKNAEADKTPNADDKEDVASTNVWEEIAKYEVDSIVEAKPNSEMYMLVYISSAETANLVDYFDELLKDTENYSCKKVTEKEVVINGYLRGSLEGKSIIVAVEYDNVKNENRVEFTSY